jgi:hypothetical protein
LRSEATDRIADSVVTGKKGNLKSILGIAAVLLLGASGWAKPVTELPYGLPDPLVLENGKAVTSSEDWPKRRAEILRLFTDHIYGQPPGRPQDISFKVETKTHMMGGKAVRKLVDIVMTGPNGKFTAQLVVFLPSAAKKPVPLFLILNHRAPNPNLEDISQYWPAEEAIARGYGIATSPNRVYSPDSKTNWRKGVLDIYEPSESWPDNGGKSITAWAWGAMRAMDYFETDPDIDEHRIAVAGHSRSGKAALWCGAQDERFALVISNNSGCTGAALARRRRGETVKQINDSFPHWFNNNYRKYNDKEDELPVDQHQLVALIAPRLVYVASASHDGEADPSGEFEAARLASPVYELLGKKGLIEESFPKADAKPYHSGRIGYHLRKGKHDFTRYDRTRYMDFADKHLEEIAREMQGQKRRGVQCGTAEVTVFGKSQVGVASCKDSAHRDGIDRKSPDDGIVIRSHFDRGSIGTLTEISPNHLKGPTRHCLKADGNGDQYYWFYFKMDHVLDQTVSVTLTDLTGTYRGNVHEVYTSYTQPVASYDRVNWFRITDVRYDDTDKEFTFTHQYTQDSVWVAYAHPYTLDRKDGYLTRIDANPHVSTETIGHSVEERSIDLVTITDGSVPDDGKKIVLITALQHPGEDCGGYFTEGVIDYLLSEDAKAVESRQRFIYKIVLMMNPDGILSGTTRYNANMEDPNSEWDDDVSDRENLPVEPEVASVKTWLSDWRQQHEIELFIDVHSHTQKNRSNDAVLRSDDLEGLFDKVASYWSLRKGSSRTTNSAGWFLQDQLGVLAFPLELTQSHPGNGQYVTIDAYLNYGAGMVKGILDYYVPEDADTVFREQRTERKKTH